MIEIGHIDISIEVSYLSRYLAQLHIGHKIQTMYIFSFLKSNKSMNLYYNPTKLNIKKATLIHDKIATGRAGIMKSIYSDASEVVFNLTHLWMLTLLVNLLLIGPRHAS